MWEAGRGVRTRESPTNFDAYDIIFERERAFLRRGEEEEGKERMKNMLHFMKPHGDNLHGGIMPF